MKKATATYLRSRNTLEF